MAHNWPFTARLASTSAAPDLLADDPPGVDQAERQDPHRRGLPRPQPVLGPVQHRLHLRPVEPAEHEHRPEVQEPHQPARDGHRGEGRGVRPQVAGGDPGVGPDEVRGVGVRQRQQQGHGERQDGRPAEEDRPVGATSARSFGQRSAEL